MRLHEQQYGKRAHVGHGGTAESIAMSGGTDTRCTDIMCLCMQGTIVDILQYIQGRVDWHDDMTWGRSLTHTAAGPTWHHETRKVVANVDFIIATG